MKLEERLGKQPPTKEISSNYLNATNETIKIIVYYLLISFLWILGSDRILEILISDADEFAKFQTYKGLLFVILTSIIFYLIIYRRLKLYVASITDLNDAYHALDKLHRNSIALEEKIFQKAYYDDLTGLPNKILLEEKVNQYIEEHEDGVMALVYLDIDEFRNVNEVKGHQIGDLLLKSITDTIKKHIKQTDILCHTGGDEFVMSFFNILDVSLFIEQVEDLFKKIKRAYRIQKDVFYVTFSGGVALAPDHGKDYITLLRHADTALSIAKQKGKDQLVFFDDEMSQIIAQRTEMLNQLREAIPNHEFSLHYQPIIDLKNGKIIGVEALIRWNHKLKGYIPPLSFISLSEKNGYIKDLTEWVFYQAAKEFNKWPIKNETFKVSINVSAVMLNSYGFVKTVKEWIETYKIDSKHVVLEVTETAVITDVNHCINVLLELRKLGFMIALDDFGTGYSSLTYLQKLPIDIIKIDRDFISHIKKETREFYVLKYMIDLAHHLDLVVVAEGIEMIEQQDLIKRYDSDYAQGYYYAKPMPQEDLIAIIDKFNS